MSGSATGTRSGPSARSAGRAGRRRALPTGRAVAGGFVVALAAVLAFAGWATTHQTSSQPWVVADRSIPAGTRLQATDLTTSALRLGNGPAASDAFSAPASLIGRTLAVAVPPGALIMRAELRSAEPGAALRPVPVTIVPADLIDLAPGDLVDVLETSGTSPGTRTSVVVRGAQVLGTDQPSSGLLGANGNEVVTLGVASLGEVESVIAAEHAGTVDVVIGEPADGTGPGRGRGST